MTQQIICWISNQHKKFLMTFIAPSKGNQLSNTFSISISFRIMLKIIELMAIKIY
jgi:hypothetical protein